MTKSLPLWVSAPGVQDLLNLLVDRIDSSEVRGAEKLQSVALTEKSWPALYKTPFESAKEGLWANVQQMQRWGWLRVSPDHAARSPSGYASTPRVSVLDPDAIRNAVGRPERVKSSVERWREAIERHLDAPPTVKKAAGEFCIDLPDQSMDEVVQRLNGLRHMADQPLLLREVSGRLFWGMSKVLDNRQGLVAALLESDECPFPESPIQLQVYLPEGGFQQVLFVENLMSFEQATRSRSGVFSGLALVYASGFKGSAQRLRKRESASLYYSNRGARGGDVSENFENWLFEGAPALPVHFWGDLDWSGMRILMAMRNSFPDLSAWQPGYTPMLANLQEGQGHSPEAADKRGQRPIGSTGCAYADDQLLPELRIQQRFVDQEIFTF